VRLELLEVKVGSRKTGDWFMVLNSGIIKYNY